MVGQPVPAPMGTFTYDPADDRWTWSDELFALHGFAPGEVVPTTSLVESHRHPDDRAAVRALVEEALRTGEPCGGQHRLVDAAGRERWVVLLLEPSRVSGRESGRESGRGSGRGPGPEAHPEAGVTAGGVRLRGRVLDLTVPHARSSADLANAMLRAATASRTVIDEAKGALMLAYGMDHDAAFELLRWYSQHTNLRLRTLAERIMQAATGGSPLLPAGARHELDEALSGVTVPGPVGSAALGPPGPAGPAGPAPVGTSGPGGLTTDRVQLPTATVLRVTGEVDLLTAPSLAAALADAAAGTRAPHPVVVDLSEVTHLGPAGVAQLLSCHRRCRHAGTELRIVVGPHGPDLPAGEHGLDVFGDLASAAA